MMMMTSIIESQDIIETLKGARKLASLVLPFDPVPASRPRVTKWGTYYGITYKVWKQRAAAYLRNRSVVTGRGIPLATPLMVVVESIIKKPKTSKARYPKGDVDNYAKGPLDAITKTGEYWEDDRQVVCLLSSKRFAAKDEQPRTEVHIYTCV